MEINYNEIYIRLIKYLIILLIISIAIILLPLNIDLYKKAIFVGLIAATLSAIFDYLIPLK
jgi:hypothetical protein|tara:strand:- start:524 stop:706 length:183 start_codon:yes stop_codon:yes gene_type:complete